MNMPDIQDIYPLSPMQQGMLFASLYAGSFDGRPAAEQDSGVYVEQTICALRGALDVEAFRRAWARLVERHDILRSAFVWEGVDKPLQIVFRDVEVPWVLEDWRALDRDEQEARLLALQRQGLDLTAAPLMRLALLRTAADGYTFVWTHHHVLLDGWSVPLLLKEVLGFYEAFRQGRDLYLPPARPYREYIAWLQAQDPAQAERFWRRYLAGFRAPTPLVVDRPATGEGETSYDDILSQELAPETTARLQEVAKGSELTVNTLVQGAWALLLHRYNSGASAETNDVVFGVTVSGRPVDLPGAETMVGLFINTLPLRVRVEPETKLLPWFGTLRAQQVDLQQVEYSALTEIHAWSEVPPSEPLFESILVFENYPVDPALKGPAGAAAASPGSLRIESLAGRSKTNLPLTVVASLTDVLTLQIAYDGRRFERGAVERMLGHLGAILESIARDPEQAVGQVDLLTAAERRQLLSTWNETEGDFPADRCIHEWFEDQARQTPDAVAATFVGALGDPDERKSLTYRELDQRANALVPMLRSCGVGPESVVGLFVERSLEALVGILGTLKAGGAYLPLDQSYPSERLAYMIQDSGIEVLLTQTKLQSLLPAGSDPSQSVRVLLLDGGEPSVTAPLSHELCARGGEGHPGPDNLAYVIYTSGSTGKPKGTLLAHRGLCNLCQAMGGTLGVGPSTRLLQFASLSFDASVPDLFMTLVFGGAIIMAPREIMASTPELTRLVRQEGVNTAVLPPSLLRLLAPEEMPGLRAVVSAGEACPLDVAARWSVGRSFFNGYGPTETTVGASFYAVRELPPGARSVPIGKPIRNARFYVLDGERRPLPVGVPGELYIGGVGVARGYLHRPELTAERFVPDPFGGAPGRLYRTGDLVRYLPDGNVEFLGRVDQQVKIRGFRVELGEVEAVLEQCPGVREAAVAAREFAPGDRRLVAYVVAKNGETLTRADLAAWARQALPDYMAPALYVLMEALPLTPNAKIDRKALPWPVGEQGEAAPALALAGEGAYAPPRDAEEELLAELWARVLGVERVGRRDNFFDLGGHSLLATQLVSRVREAFAVELPLHALFDHPTVEGLAEEIDRQRGLGSRAGLSLQSAPREVDEAGIVALPLSFAQQRLWFLDQLDPQGSFYNIPSALRLRGPLDHAALVWSLNEMARRHEVLRTCFVNRDGTPVQVIAPLQGDAASWQALDIPVEDLSALPEGEREARALALATAEAQQPFDLSRAPLMRARLLRLGEQDHVALFTLHHIIADGWSMTVFTREITALYAARVHGAPSPLAPLPVQYADYAQWQRAWLQGEELDRQLDYWKRQLAHAPDLLALPADHPRPAMQTFRGETLSSDVPAGVARALKALGRAEGVTLFMTLLAAFQTLLYRYTSEEDICVGTPIANRRRGELEGLIGFFVNTLVLRADLSGEPSFRDLLLRVRDTALGAYAHQDLPFEMLVEAVQPRRDLSHTPLFQVMFVLQNVQRGAEGLAGLSISPVQAESGVSKFDLTLVLEEDEAGLACSWEYNSDLFERQTIERMMGHWRVLLEGIVADPDEAVGRLPLLSAPERRQALVDWNRTEADYAADCGAHELVARQAARIPQAIALTFEGRAMTYGELDERANRLAATLRGLGVGPDTFVGLCAQRSMEMVVAILAVMKAGGAYVPLDPTYPADRLAFMVEDSGIPVLLTQSHLLESLPPHHARVLCLDAEGDWPGGAPDAPSAAAGPDNLAYMIYTSGSTGRPKGAMLRHRGLCNLIAAQRRLFGIEDGTRVLQFSPLSFDASVWETFMALGNGGTLCLARQDRLAFGPELLRVLAEDRVNIATLPPSVLKVLEPEALPDLRTIVAAGEACGQELVERWARGRRFFNAYGPTETTVCASAALCEPGAPGSPPIGRPISNTRLYVLDSRQQPVPVGVAGELCVGGVSLAAGYWQRPELTAERFIPDPFAGPWRERPGSGAPRLYRTGDLVRYRPDSNIEFLGRIDHQVKLRGVRIELGEIEAVLAQHPAVREAAALVREDRAGNQWLVGYVVPLAAARDGEDARLDTGALRAYLRERLPEYMAPTHYVVLEAMPLTPNGKVDRKALPAPESERPALDREYVAPRTETESKLAQLYADLLGVERVGLYDGFFALGGHSLLATQLVSRLRRTFGVELPLRSLFEEPTVAALALAVDQAIQAAQAGVGLAAPAIVPLAREARQVRGRRPGGAGAPPASQTENR